MRKKITSILKRLGLHEVEEPSVVFDVVCGMELRPDKVKFIVEHTDGTAYHFCSKSCEEHFIHDPGKYIGQ